MVELSPRVVNGFKDTASNVLVLWLFNMSLLDVDVNTAGSQYPVAPLSDNAYGLNSGQTMSLNFRRLSDPENRFSFSSGE